MNRLRYEWLAAYDIGMPDVDSRHHHFLNLINRLSANNAVDP